jgi:hypothetical protein
MHNFIWDRMNRIEFEKKGYSKVIRTHMNDWWILAGSGITFRTVAYGGREPAGRAGWTHPVTECASGISGHYPYIR